MILFVLRGVFLVLVASVVTLYVNSEFQQRVGLSFGGIFALISGIIAVAAGVVGLDIAIRRKRLSAISGVFLGLLVGLVFAYALSFVVDLVAFYLTPREPDQRAAYEELIRGLKVIIGLVTSYIAMSLVLQTKDDFRFVIPYVEFAKEVRGSRPTVLDTSVIVDGRILDIADTKVMQGGFIIPRFVLDELQQISDSADRMKRTRGRRGLDRLQKLRDHPHLEVRIDDGIDRDAADSGVDGKLVAASLRLGARLMTNDFNLAKVAKLRGVEVINLNDLARALRPVLLPGETLQVQVVKTGEGSGQGVGYLEDGTMVVVDGGRDHVDKLVDAEVTSSLQTSAGRMIFARFAGTSSSTGGGPGRKGAAEGAKAVPDSRDDPRPENEEDPQAGSRSKPADPDDKTPKKGSPSRSATPRGSRPSRRNPRR